MADEDWTVPKKLGTDYTDPHQRDHDKITVTRGHLMWLMRESVRLSRQVQVVELENIELKAESERSRDQYNGIIDTQLESIARLKAEADKWKSWAEAEHAEKKVLKAEVEQLQARCDFLEDKPSYE
jgi:hypothetical protein